MRYDLHSNVSEVQVFKIFLTVIKYFIVTFFLLSFTLSKARLITTWQMIIMTWQWDLVNELEEMNKYGRYEYMYRWMGKWFRCLRNNERFIISFLCGTSTWKTITKAFLGRKFFMWNLYLENSHKSLSREEAFYVQHVLGKLSQKLFLGGSFLCEKKWNERYQELGLLLRSHKAYLNTFHSVFFFIKKTIVKQKNFWHGLIECLYFL